MRTVTDLNEIKNLLSNYQFEMFNALNDYKGELTTLNEIDIDDILYDMRLGFQSAIVETDDKGKVIVTYPNNVCRLESREPIQR